MISTTLLDNKTLSSYLSSRQATDLNFNKTGFKYSEELVVYCGYFLVLTYLICSTNEILPVFYNSHGLLVLFNAEVTLLLGYGLKYY
jgi:hypothetical protein